MAFYTADYIRKLVKEDHINVTAITKKTNFRSYIDRTLPFTLYLDLNTIINQIISPNSIFINEIKKIPGINIEVVIAEITKAYKKVIKYYQNSYPIITPDELNLKINNFLKAVQLDAGTIVPTLKAEFSQTMVYHNNQNWVIIISPSFNTVQSNFGSKFKEFFNLDAFEESYNDEPLRQRVATFLNKNFGNLQNIGHIETDIISSTDTKVKRGLVTPKLLQAIIEAPTSLKPKTIARRFSKETGQVDTRVIIRKKFSGTKMVLEMLSENGFMIGSLESTYENQKIKAPLEQKFTLGKKLKKLISEKPDFLINLSTSKTILEYGTEVIVQTIKGKRVPNYNTSTTIYEKTKFTLDTLEINIPKPKSSSIRKLRTLKGQFASPISIMNLINGKLAQQIQQNMGKGNAKSILNYRTGRFAESAKVTSISSRSGHIDAFYTYMKNPYQTFEPGFAQGSETRDPRKLIQRSIRQIAAELVANRLRVIPV